MKDRYSLYLKIGYFSLFSIMTFSSIAMNYLHAYIRAILFFITFTPITIIHLIISKNINAIKTNKFFFLLSILWIIKYVVFITNEGMNFFFQEIFLILEWIDSYLLHIIALLVSISFILKKPFWYEKSAKSGYIALGIVLLAISVFGTLAITFGLMEYTEIK